MDARKKSDRKPMVLVFAGPNGSGKSTITDYFEKIGRYTNADDIVRTTGRDNKEAAIEVEALRRESIKKKEDFSFETVLSSDHSMNILRTARREDYFIKCVYVLTKSPDINYARVKARVAMNGHDVEKGKIYSRYEKSLKNIPELMKICDILHIYDNSRDENGFSRIVRKHKEEDIILFPNALWSEEEILKLIGEN